MAKCPSHTYSTQLSVTKNIFFHWNCDGGGFDRKFVNGLVELSCYLPSGNSNDKFSDCTLFFNLRGEARDHTAQLTFLRKSSFMSVVLLFEEDCNKTVCTMMQELATLPGGVVIMLPDLEQTKKHSRLEVSLKSVIQEEKVTLFDLKHKNEDDIKSGIQELISRRTMKANRSAFLALSELPSTIKNIEGINIDEDHLDCMRGHNMAKETMKILKPISIFKAKATLLPLQGPELWRQWAKHDKESYKTTEAAAAAVIEKNKKVIRKKQYNDYVEPKLTPLMKSFVDAFVKLKNYPLPKKYFLQWLKLYLDDRSRETLPEMHENYAKLRNDFKRSSVSEALKLSDMLLVQSNNLMEGSLGLEHFFRELGQLYEAKISNHCRKGDVQLYPKIAVDILSAGYPIELMDGDASHVPIIWVSAVLNILAKQHKGKKIFVISILGVQSSGKSTLLNTMFGLQFHVSAGRCTRGAFFQLLPVKKSSATFKTKCDFVLIVDTEGVRAPELESDQSFKHDNELATFAIGLADVSIINIFGETPGDLNDIIQTAAHAFIRMKNIDLQLRCHFVHQNVSAVSGDKHAKFGHKKYQDRLDEMTRLAAVAENCEGKYYSFQDIIMFDEDTDVTYFPGLWKGDPPMASVNPGYSEKALQLKSALVTLADELQSDSNFTAFQIRLEKLWTAVCRENYIFSFKNTLEVIAYNELDAKFGDWSWLLHRVLLDWKYEAGNSVNNCSRDQIATTVSEYLNKAKVVLNKKYDTVFESMQEFFEKSEHARTLAQWKKRYEVRLQHLNEDRIEEAKKFCDSLKVNRECHLKLEDLQKNHRQEILKQLTDLAVITRQNNGKLSSQQIEEMFDRKWNQWLENFSSIEWTEFYPQDTIVEREIDISVQKLLGKYSQNIAAELRKTPLIEQGKGFISFTIDQQRHINYGSNSTTPNNTGIFHKVTKFFGLSKESCAEIATKETDKFISQGKDILSDIRKTFQNFDQSCVC